MNNEIKHLRRRGMSGIYIFDKFPFEDKRKPTCLEDCQEETRKKYLEGQDEEFLINTIEILCQTIRNMSDEFGICAVGGDDDETAYEKTSDDTKYNQEENAF